MVSPQLAALSDPDRELLEAWLVAFDKSWNDQALPAQTDRLNELPQHLHAAALVELVKIDLERQWQQGARVTLDSYLQQYPALGTSESLPADLILAEYEIRRNSKSRPKSTNSSIASPTNSRSSANCWPAPTQFEAERRPPWLNHRGLSATPPRPRCPQMVAERATPNKNFLENSDATVS